MKLRYVAAYGAPLLHLYRRLNLLSHNAGAANIRILVFHHIPGSKLAIFRRLLHCLASHYKFLTPSQFEDSIQGKFCPAGISLLITFDDGFKSNRIVAEEILNPLGIKGLFFVPTEFVGLSGPDKQKQFVVRQIYDEHITDSEMLSDMKPLTWRDLEYLLEQGHVVGSHSKTHRRLSEIYSQEDLYDEIVQAGNILENKLGVSINHFAYPFGDIDSINGWAMDLIKKRYKYCFSGIRGANNSCIFPYAILRDAIAVDDPPIYVRLIIENGIDFIYRTKAERLLELAKS
jgi:peptidoglycan/xylan/chitin deacetylase (PgdA/CDA1 family)